MKYTIITKCQTWLKGEISPVLTPEWMWLEVWAYKTKIQGRIQKFEKKGKGRGQYDG